LLGIGPEKRPIEVKVADSMLTLTLADGKQKTYRKLDAVPPELVLQPLKLGQPTELDATRIKEIADELLRRRETDQQVRKDPAKRKDMAKVDADNTAYLIKLVKEVGWIDADRFGAQASHAAFLIVQHSGDLPLMIAGLPAIEKDAKAKKLGDGQPYALLYDRLQLRLGRKQKYGTQIGESPKGELYVLPLVDPAKVEEYRKEIGVSISLREYLRIYKQLTDKTVKILDE
jgi:hypothetical protein